MRKWFIALILTFATSSSFAEPMEPSTEHLMGFMTSINGVHIQVRSGGCTTKRSFVVKREKAGTVAKLTFVRVEYDPCLALHNYGVLLSYTYDELDISRNENFIVSNPLTYSRATSY